MFAEMKNKIREKAGGELPKLPSPATALRRHSRQSSASSVSSLMQETPDKSSSEHNGTRDSFGWNGAKNKLPKGTEESRQTSNGSDEDARWRKKEQTYVDDLLKQTRELQAALKKLEEYESKFNSLGEEKDQLENFQTQEIAKIKHLLLAKENENNSNVAQLKENQALIDSLKAEVSRLRPFEDRVSSLEDDMEILRHTSERERWQLSSKLAQNEEEISHLKERVAVLSRRAQAECQALGAQLTVDERIQSLLGERSLLERRLEEAHIHLSEIKTTWSEKISSLETQVERLGRQAVEEGCERRKTEAQIEELERRLRETQEEKETLSKKVDELSAEKVKCEEELKVLEQQIAALSADKSGLASRLAESTSALSAAEASNKELRAELAVFRETLIRERKAAEEAKRVLERERTEKDEALMRSAEMSMKAQLAENALKALRLENQENAQKILDEQKSEDEKSIQANELNSKLVDLENQLVEKNKTIRVLQQRMSDLKKMLQKEVVNSGESNCVSRLPLDEDINLKYLKHVVIKFLTCRDYEAQHLTRAVATLLRMSADEERLLRETVDWRMSWFGSRPQLPPLQR